MHRFPTVLFMDCTYQTNKYKLPMLHIIGFTSTNQSYTAGVAFLLRETTDWNKLALSTFHDLTGAQNLPTKVIIIDREPALINVLSDLYPNAYRLKCLWP